MPADTRAIASPLLPYMPCTPPARVQKQFFRSAPPLYYFYFPASKPLEKNSSNAGAAVALVCVKAKDPQYLILKRARHPGDPWSGHLAFPGGRREPGDGNLFVTVVRECFEECHIRLQREHLLTILPAAMAGNALGNPVLVEPYVFELEQTPELQLCTTEIESSRWLAESHLLQPEVHLWGPVMTNQGPQDQPHCMLGKDVFWGFSYRVLMSHLWHSGKLQSQRFSSILAPILKV